jgi:hypothetical protein
LIFSSAFPEPKPNKAFKRQEKTEYEWVRRWHVSISEIEIQNLTQAPINPFIRFTIGGNFYLEVLKLGSGAIKYFYKGKSGNQQISDVIRYLEPNQTKLFKKSMNCEVYQSYF